MNIHDKVHRYMLKTAEILRSLYYWNGNDKHLLYELQEADLELFIKRVKSTNIKGGTMNREKIRTKLEKLLRKAPEGINAHNFKICNTWGGVTYEAWCHLYKYKSIWIGFHNYRWVVLVSSNPDAEWERGANCQTAYGNPLPQSKTAYFIDPLDLPVKAQEVVVKWIEEAIDECRKLISAELERRRLKEREEERKAMREFHRTVVNPWLRKVKEEL